MKTIVGGTFDILHDGHKKLLDGAIRATRDDVLTVGITTDDMLKKKQHPVAPYMKRLIEVYRYLNGKVNFTIIDLDEPVPPKALDPAVECIVISTEDHMYETALFINKERACAGVSELYIFVVPTVKDYRGTRISTTAIHAGYINEHGKKLCLE